MFKRIFILLCAALILAACSGQSGEEAGKNDLKKEIETTLRENPRLILDLLTDHKEELFEVVQAGANIKRRKVMLEERKKQLKDPLVPMVDEARPSIGPADAPITIIEYSDFQCPYCSKGAQMAKQVQAKYKSQARLFFKHLPLQNSHPQAMTAAKYFEAASLQDPAKAWALHDAMFRNQAEMQNKGEEWIKNSAQALGLDMEKLTQDAQSEAVAKRIQSDREEATKFKIPGTPSFIINGVLAPGLIPLDEFVEIIEMIRTEQAKEKPEEMKSDS